MVAAQVNPIINTFMSIIDDGISILFTREIGYAEGQGVGGSVTQLTSKSTGVTLNAVCGRITMHNETMAAQDTKSFQMTNSYMHQHDVLILNVVDGTAGAYRLNARPNDGHADIDITRGPAGGSLSEAVVISFAIFKASVD